MNARQLTEALGGRWRGSYGVACCPTHEDCEPSLSLRDGPDGDVLVKCHAKCDWRDVKDALRSRGLLPALEQNELRRTLPRLASPRERKPDPDEQRRIDVARGIWHKGREITGTPAEIYLRERGLKPGQEGWPVTLRYHSGLKHGPTGLLLPALVAAVCRWPDHDVRAIHRTFIRADGRDKAPVTTNKAMLGPCAGGAVRLAALGSTLVIGEGIETCLSVQQATGLPVWACLSTSGMTAVILPVEVKTVIIAADGDKAGEKAAQQAARRFVAEGRKAKIARPPAGKDFNDVLLMPENVIPLNTRRTAHG